MQSVLESANLFLILVDSSTKIGLWGLFYTLIYQLYNLIFHLNKVVGAAHTSNNTCTYSLLHNK